MCAAIMKCQPITMTCHTFVHYVMDKEEQSERSTIIYAVHILFPIPCWEDFYNIKDEPRQTLN